VTAAATALEVDPAANPLLRARFPGLVHTLDPDTMRTALQSALTDGRGDVVACSKPRAEVGATSCFVQWAVTFRADTGETSEITVVGSTFSRVEEARDFERTVLAPQVREMRAHGNGPPTTCVIDSLNLALSVFPVNGALPLLHRALDLRHVADVLRATLPDARVTRAELVELRRARGCVLRYQVLADSETTVYGKVGHHATDAVAQGLNALEEESAARGDHEAFFPHWLGCSPETGLTLVSELCGTRPDLSASGDQAAAVAGAARVAARLHRSGVRVQRHHTFDDEVARAREAAELVARDDPGLGSRLLAVLESAESAGHRGAPAAVLAHGSFAPSQLVMDGARIGVLDFDRLCMCEPGFDLGRFTAPLRVTLAKNDSGAAGALAGEFLGRYLDLGGAAGSETRAGLYELVSLTRMAARSWLQLKRSRLHHVLRVLDGRLAEMGMP